MEKKKNCSTKKGSEDKSEQKMKGNKEDCCCHDCDCGGHESKNSKSQSTKPTKSEKNEKSVTKTETAKKAAKGAAAADGSIVKVHYKGTFDDGTVFDSSDGKDPITFTIGAGQVIKGFDDAVRGMKTGEEKNIKLVPGEAYGERNPQLVQSVPRHLIPLEGEIKKGMVLALRGPDGNQFPVLVSDANSETVTLDFNHPMAGKTLNFKLTLVNFE